MIVLQIYFQIDNSKINAFEDMYSRYYMPALQKQKGYLGSKLLKVYSHDVASEFDATPTEYNYQMELNFDSESNRRVWASGSDHSAVWRLVEVLSEKTQWRGYDAIGYDNANIPG